MEYETLRIDQSRGVTKVTLNRPDILNALNADTLLELKDLFAKLRGDLDTRCVVLTGAGKAFSVGVEISKKSLEERYSRPGLSTERLWQLFGHDFMRDMENLEQITVAAINGACLGAGLCLAMNCDFRIASENAFFGVPEVNLGLFFTWGATPRLTALIGPAKAKEMIITGDSISATEAWRIGLVNKVVPPYELMTACDELVNKIASKGPTAVRIAKKQVNAASVAKMADLYLCEPELVERVMLSGEVDEGIQAFIDKRPPRFL